MTSTLPPIVQAFSGAIGSAIANAASYPLELVTTRLQTTRSKKLQGVRGAFAILIYTVKKYGISALYDGLNSDTASTILSSFLYFYAYSFLRFLLMRRSPSPSKTPLLSASQELCIGFIAGVASRLISSPLSIITVRLQMEREGSDDEIQEVEKRVEKGEGEKVVEGSKQETGLLRVVRLVYQEEGLAGFWRGFETTVLLSLNPSFTFFFFQLYRRSLLRYAGTRRPSPRQDFIGAALANSLAVTILYPLILAKTRVQLAKSQSSDSDDSHPSIQSVLYDAYTKTNVFTGGLYQGLEAQIAKGFLSQGITLMMKRRQLLPSLWLCDDNLSLVNHESWVITILQNFLQPGDLSITAMLCLRTQSSYVKAKAMSCGTFYDDWQSTTASFLIPPLSMLGIYYLLNILKRSTGAIATARFRGHLERTEKKRVPALPNELLYQIIATVIGNFVTDILLQPDVLPPWEWDAMLSLLLTSKKILSCHAGHSRSPVAHNVFDEGKLALVAQHDGMNFEHEVKQVGGTSWPPTLIVNLWMIYLTNVARGDIVSRSARPAHHLIKEMYTDASFDGLVTGGNRIWGYLRSPLLDKFMHGVGVDYAKWAKLKRLSLIVERAPGVLSEATRKNPTKATRKTPGNTPLLSIQSHDFHQSIARRYEIDAHQIPMLSREEVRAMGLPGLMKLLNRSLEIHGSNAAVVEAQKNIMWELEVLFTEEERRQYLRLRFPRDDDGAISANDCVSYLPPQQL
ncbi:hypothetical protein EW146_g5369 [Bondarzewia mesenterica]|uniref:Mitochondrial carrier n=1 Tax=Bondarzewia mesenterica TaxID=1095465 RepID=A0A4S4LTL6_9AGAM|nr:hypothetical protein EW146_g5369 [Bondarzewia mesenterica]